MKQYLMAGAAVMAIMAAAPASADVTGSLATSSGGTTFLSLTDGNAATRGLYNGSTKVATLVGGTIYNSDQPFADIPKGSIFGNSFLAAGPSSNTAALITFQNATNFLSFLWGSPDTYNRLTIGYGLGQTKTFTAADLGFTSTNGNQAVSQYVQFRADAGTLINSVLFFNNPSTDAFESANFSVTAVPEPATWAMMLMGFGGIGFAMRRRKSKVTTNVSYA